jgi:ABC-2 type transport system permease protein|tara:strand:+ start:183 stop:1844 length:1662 start_codon:yes stop_codon:yes gene_type:complete
MSNSVLLRTFEERWRGFIIAAVTLAVFFLFGMAVYRDVDLSFYGDLPEAVQIMMNIPEGAGVGSLAYGAIYGLYGAIVMGIMAAITGASLIAGEERNGTLGLLLSNPRSRTEVLVSKTVALLILLIFATVVLYIAGRLVPMVLGVKIVGMHVEAQLFHIFINSVFYGFLGLMLGVWTGNGGWASGTSIGIMIISVFGSGLFPLIEGLENFSKIFPWYYFDGSDPITNGVNYSHIIVLSIASVVFGFISVVVVNRRDLKGQAVGLTLIDRLRINPMTQKFVDRIAGSTKVSHIWVKTVYEYQILLIAAAYYLFLVAMAVGPFYSMIDESLVKLSEQLPETLMALAGGGDMSTPEGYYSLEHFSLMAPFILMMVTITVGAKALAGEESKGMMGLLLANPISRSRVVYEKMAAMIILTMILGIATFGGTVLGSLLGGLDMSFGNIAAISLLVSLLGLAFGTLALSLSAAIGQVGIAVFGSFGSALIFYLLDVFLPLNNQLAPYAKWSPFYYYSDSDPLINGMQWSHGAVLAAITVILGILSVVLFQRRDLRDTQNG